MEQDTSPEGIRRYHELLRRMTPAERFRAAANLTDSVRRLALVGLRSRHPESSEAELRIRLAVRLYGREVADRLYGQVPDDAR